MYMWNAPMSNFKIGIGGQKTFTSDRFEGRGQSGKP